VNPVTVWRLKWKSECIRPPYSFIKRIRI